MANAGSSEIIDKEKEVRVRLSKSIVAKKKISKGMAITTDMLTVKGPGNGLKPKYIPQLCGKIAQCDLNEDAHLPQDSLNWPTSV